MKPMRCQISVSFFENPLPLLYSVFLQVFLNFCHPFFLLSSDFYLGQAVLLYSLLCTYIAECSLETAATLVCEVAFDFTYELEVFHLYIISGNKVVLGLGELYVRSHSSVSSTSTAYSSSIFIAICSSVEGIPIILEIYFRTGSTSP